MPTVNVALIGHAFMGRAHSNAYRQVTPFFSPRLTPRLKVMCGTNPAETAKAARALGWDEASTDWESVVRRKDIDIVDVSTPGDLHAPMAIAAARAGKVVFCEKPLANTVREAERMLAAVRKARVIHMICHNYRRVPAVMLAKDLVERGELGDIRHFRAVYLQDWIGDPNLPLLWRFDKKRAGSGALGDIGAHIVDLARFLVGEIAEVSGDLRTFIRTRPLPGNPRRRGRVTVDDAALAVARFANGATATFEATRLALGRKNHNRFEINGSRGSLAFDLERMNELDLYLESGPKAERGFRRILVTETSHPFVKAWWPPGHIIGYEHTFTHTVYDLLEAIADDRVPEPNFADGVRTQRVLDGIERSARTRRWQRV
ncbi:MAG TPA: Gfo/Idh/MocA family oxidoreductase [Vicinamibacterales bacterium]|nr:Gfo/Idh/MocA family oxidoreductase [Vicinamibacterales bacterium]